MEEILKRKNNETDFEYKIRLCIAKLNKEIDLDWIEIVELLGLDCSSDHLRKLSYGYKECMDYIEEYKKSNLSENEVLKKIEEKTLEMEKTKIQCQDQRREMKKYIREIARFEHLVEKMKDELNKINESKKLLPLVVLKNKNLINEAILMCSDWHLGAKFKNCFAEYNIKIAKNRIASLKEKTIEYCKFNKVNTLHIELLGDNQNGLIHIGSRVESDEDVISQTMTLCEILSEFISDLGNNIPNIKVYSVIGNHARVSANLKESIERENLERFVPFYLKSRLEKFNNIEIIENTLGDDIVITDIMNSKILMVHGNLDKPQFVIDNMVKAFKVFPSEIHMAHYHHHYEKEEYDMEVVINGSLMGTDTYAKSIRKTGRPMQKLMIYNEDGKLCTYKIKF